MKKRFLFLALALLPLAGCHSEKKDVEERALELCAYIPDHGFSDDADKYLTDSYMRAYQEAMDIPEWVEYAGEIGDKEFLLYFVSGNGASETEYKLSEIRMIDEGHAEVDVEIRQKWDDGTVDEEPSRKGTMKLVLVDGDWKLDDFDGTKGKCLEFIRKTREELRSGAALDSLKNSGWEEEDFIERFEDDVEQFYEQYGRDGKTSAVFSSETIPASVETRMRGVSYPEGAEIKLSDLRYLRLSYVDFDGKDQVGEMVCNLKISDDLLAIFQALYEARYPIRSIRLIDDFEGDDEASMAADNSSCFNYRTKTGMRSLSKHALGLAVDINPLENPYVRPSRVRPSDGTEYADRSKDFPHKIDTNDLCYKLFREHGFSWGGTWRSVKDYQHFEK